MCSSSRYTLLLPWKISPVIDFWRFTVNSLYFKTREGTKPTGHHSNQQDNKENHWPHMIYRGGNPAVSNTIQKRPEGATADCVRLSEWMLPDSTHTPAAMSENRQIWGPFLKVHLLPTLRHPHSDQSSLVTGDTPTHYHSSLIGNTTSLDTKASVVFHRMVYEGERNKSSILLYFICIYISIN